MSDQTEKKTSPVLRVLRFVVRLLLVIFVGILIGGGLYYGIVTGYQKIIQPLKDHEMRLDALESINEQTDTELSGKLQSFDNRLEQLEKIMDSQKESLAKLDSRLTTLEASFSADEETISTVSEAYKEFENRQQEIDKAIDGMSDTLHNLSDDVKALKTTVEGLNVAQDENQQAVDKILADAGKSGEQWAGVHRTLNVLTVMEILARSRFSLSQGLFTLAKADIQDARDRLSSLLEGAPSDQAEALAAAVDSLDDALRVLPRSSMAASGKVEAAWDLLARKIPDMLKTLPAEASMAETEETDALQPSGTPVFTVTPTQTLTSTMAVTPTPMLTLTPTPTP